MAVAEVGWSAIGIVRSHGTTQTILHTGDLKYVKTREQWEGSCTCGWFAAGVAGPGTEAMIRDNLDLHFSRIRPKERP